MTLRSHEVGEVVVLTIDRADRRNALDLEVIGALDDALASMAEGDAPAAVILAGDGPTFSAGLDMAVFASFAQGDDTEIEAVIDRSAGLIERLTAMPCLTVAAVQGVAAGPSMAIALACDLRLVTESAKFVPGFFRFGGTPDGGVSAMLVRAVGLSRAISASVTDRPLRAAELVQLGLAERSAPDTDLVDAAVELAVSVGRRPPDAWPRLRSVLSAAATNELGPQLDLERETAKRLIGDDGFRQTIAALVTR